MCLLHYLYVYTSYYQESTIYYHDSFYNRKTIKITDLDAANYFFKVFYAGFLKFLVYLK
jgi:hypothetical protein